MPDSSRGRWHIEPLMADHNRAGFDCGVATLNDYLKKFARQNQKTGVSRTFVAVRAGRTAVDGYYCLSAGSVKGADLTVAQRKRLPRYPIPVAHLGRLAVAASAQGRGLGEQLLTDALERVVRIADELGIHAVEVVAKDDSAAAFYRKYGFAALRDDRLHLYLPLSVIRKLNLI